MPIITMADIAKEANVSPTTVARVVNDKGYVSEEKRKLVQNAIESLGFVPNKVAQGLRNHNTHIIGHVFPSSYINPFFAQVAYAVDKAADSVDYQVLTVVTDADIEKERKQVENLVSRMVEAVVITSTAAGTEIIEWILKIGIPVIMIERPKDVRGIDKILINNYEGAALAVSHVISKGHKRIGFVCMDTNHKVEIEKFEGYRNTLIQAGLEVSMDNVKLVKDYTSAYGYTTMKEILEGKNPPTAVFLASDIFACGALQYLYEKKIRIPDDISLIGYDNTLAGILTPPITSVSFPMEEIGKVTMQMLLERKNDKRISDKAVTLSPILVDRGSVKDVTKV